MAKRSHRHNDRRNKGRSANAAAPTRTPLEPIEQKARVLYGKPFIVLEDAANNTFVFSGGRWVEHSASIAECRVDCQVKKLPQKINGMTRYEVARPV